MQATQKMSLWCLDQEDALEKGMATHSSVLAWPRSPEGYSPRGRKESDTTEWAHAHGVPITVFSWTSTKHFSLRGKSLFIVLLHVSFKTSLEWQNIPQFGARKKVVHLYPSPSIYFRVNSGTLALWSIPLVHDIPLTLSISLRPAPLKRGSTLLGVKCIEWEFLPFCLLMQTLRFFLPFLLQLLYFLLEGI